MDTKTKYLICIVIYPKKFTLAHNVFEVMELCHTRANVLKPTLDRTLVASHITKILNVEVLALIFFSYVYDLIQIFKKA